MVIGPNVIDDCGEMTEEDYYRGMEAAEEFDKNMHDLAERLEVNKLPESTKLLRHGISRQEWHDKAWALYHAKTFNDTMLTKVNIHTIRTVFDATYDALINKT